MGKRSTLLTNTSYSETIEVIGELKGHLQKDPEGLALVKKLEKSCHLYFRQRQKTTDQQADLEKQKELKFNIVKLLMRLADLVDHHWEDIKELAHKITEFIIT